MKVRTNTNEIIMLGLFFESMIIDFWVNTIALDLFKAFFHQPKGSF
jgi:hypothetical protein